MRALTKEWVDKAEADFLTACREARVRKAPNYDAVCFHCQQCIEKYLKAFLQKRGQRFRRIHDLIELLGLCLPYDASFELHRDLFKDLNGYAVNIRYPGESATREMMRITLRETKLARAFLRQKLGLS